MKKTIISLSLASTLLMSTVALAGGTDDKMVISENTNDKEVISVVEQSKDTSNYIKFSGKIKEVNREDGSMSIVVDEKDMLNETNQPSMGVIKFNISPDTVILSNETQNIIESDKLMEGAVVEVSYGKDSPMTRSLPPMTNADVIVLKESKGENAQVGIKVEKFGKNQTSIDNDLKYNITEETVIIDQKGNKLEEKDLYDESLIVFYGPATTMSIPAQSNAVKIIALLEEKEVETPEINNEIKVLDKIIYNKDETLSAEISLKNKIYKSGDTFMIPVREIVLPLGYTVSWNNSLRQAELTKGVNFITAAEDKDLYSFSKMTVKLGKTPEIKQGTMFVPVDFIEEVMQLDMEVTADGTINIK